MKLFELSFSTIVLRYYLMMLVVIVAGFTGQWWLAVLALPIFLSCLMAIKFSGNNSKNSNVQRTLSQPDQAIQSAA